jgi:hypothetical protein
METVGNWISRTGLTRGKTRARFLRVCWCYFLGGYGFSKKGNGRKPVKIPAQFDPGEKMIRE